ncbi:MAG: glycosyltransferase family 2 protein [Planctomycetota bacterium]
MPTSHHPPPPRTLVAIPVYNEAPTLERVLCAVRAHAEHVLVIDDGSTDATPSVVDRLAHELGIDVLRHARNLGYGRSLIDAFAHASEHAFAWVVTMDCDEQHEPAALPRFFRAISSAAQPGGADIISGSRYLNPALASDRPPPDRRAINAELTAELNERLRLGITDAFCGFKAHRVRALEAAGLAHADAPGHTPIDPGYAVPMQLWARAAAAGLRIRELPVRLLYTDPTRTFGGTLDDPTQRLHHYRCVLHRELAHLRSALRERIGPSAAAMLDQTCGCPEPAHA